MINTPGSLQPQDVFPLAKALALTSTMTPQAHLHAQQAWDETPILWEPTRHTTSKLPKRWFTRLKRFSILDFRILLEAQPQLFVRSATRWSSRTVRSSLPQRQRTRHVAREPIGSPRPVTDKSPKRRPVSSRIYLGER